MSPSELSQVACCRPSAAAGHWWGGKGTGKKVAPSVVLEATRVATVDGGQACSVLKMLTQISHKIFLRALVGLSSNFR